MQPEHIVTTAAVSSLVWAFGATTALLCRWRRPGVWYAAYAAASWLVLLGVLWIDSLISLGHNSAVHLLQAVTSGDPHHLCAAGLGFSLGLGPALWPWQKNLRSRARCTRARMVKALGFASIMASFGFLGLFAAQEELRPYVRTRNLASIVSDPGAFGTPAGFRVDEYHKCEFFYPVQLAIGPDGDLFATGYWGAAMQDGIVARIAQDTPGGPTRETLVARNLSRPHGLAFHDGVLYVSRCGQHVKAEAGALVGVPTGAVTRMRDLDGDGLMDFFEDVLPDLPGAQGPDPLHQNNGIAFNAAGDLFVTVGRHADRAPASGPFEGTLLRLPAGSQQPEVFAEGVRNPFDLTFGPDGELFFTDNDSSDRQNGDEINHAIEGAHYGFPYADGRMPHPEGTIAPLAVVANGTCQGITYADSAKLPLEFRNCLYVVSYGSGEILRVKLHREGDSYRAETSLFARIPNALDITVDENGVFYVSCFEQQTIYRLTPES